MSIDDDTPLSLKITLLGEFFVGKTSITSRFIEGTFDDTYSATIGVKFLSKEVTYNDRKYVLNVWDTSGSERYRSVAPNYYRGSDGCILVYDLSNIKTLEPLKYWLEEFRSLSSTASDSSVQVILVGNKSDLEHSEDTVLAAEQFAEKHGIIKHIKTSALTGENVEEAFNALVELCSHHQKQQLDSVTYTLQPPQKKPCAC